MSLSVALLRSARLTVDRRGGASRRLMVIIFEDTARRIGPAGEGRELRELRTRTVRTWTCIVRENVAKDGDGDVVEEREKEINPVTPGARLRRLLIFSANSLRPLNNTRRRRRTSPDRSGVPCETNRVRVHYVRSPLQSPPPPPPLPIDIFILYDRYF